MLFPTNVDSTVSISCLGEMFQIYGCHKDVLSAQSYVVYLFIKKLGKMIKHQIKIKQLINMKDETKNHAPIRKMCDISEVGFLI